MRRTLVGTLTGCRAGAALILAVALMAGHAHAARVVLSVRMGDTQRAADVEVFYRRAVPHVSLNYLVRQLGGGCRVTRDRVQVDLAAQSAWLAPEETQVNASLEAFTLAHPVTRQGGDVLMALSDVAPFFHKAFRLELLQQTVVETPVAVPGQAEPEEMALSPLEPLASSAHADQADSQGPPRLGDLEPELFIEELTPLRREDVAPGPPTPAPRTVDRDVRVVIIDPGHGGSDPGSVGSGGLRECDLTLALAMRLEQILEKTTHVQALLTREKDRTLTGRERVSFANTNRGDLLLSIHAGAAFSPQAHGFEIYCCKEGQEVEDGTLPEAARSVGSAYAARSRAIAEQVAAALAKATETEPSPVRELRCHLLTDLAMPGMLIEVGFLTNPSEEAMLETQAYQTALAEGIAAGVRARLTATPTQRGAP